MYGTEHVGEWGVLMRRLIKAIIKSKNLWYMNNELLINAALTIHQLRSKNVWRLSVNHIVGVGYIYVEKYDLRLFSST